MRGWCESMNRKELVQAYRDEGLELVCHYCKVVFCDSNPATMDHVVPRAVGGTKDRDNLVLACGRCNHERGRVFESERSYRVKGIMVSALSKLVVARSFGVSLRVRQSLVACATPNPQRKHQSCFSSALPRPPGGPSCPTR